MATAVDEKEWQSHPPEGVFLGAAANLGPLRLPATREMALAERLGFGISALQDDKLLFVRGMPCTAIFGTETETNKPVSGMVYVTSLQVWFVHDTDMANDVSVHAKCISLHALTEDDPPSLYLQLNKDDGTAAVTQQQQQSEKQQQDNEENGANNKSTVIEWTLTPTEKYEKKELKEGEEDNSPPQLFFRALCKLVALHPLEEQDEYETGGVGGGHPASSSSGGGDNDMKTTEVVWAPNTKTGFQDTSKTTTDEEQAKMLEKLDQLVVVEHEVKQGQFEDADEEEK